MKKVSCLALSGVCLLFSQTCVAHWHHDHVFVAVNVPSPAYVVVESQPPVELVETMVPAPGPGYAWVKGRWEWDGKWEWKSGCWVASPHPSAVWISGGWEAREHHWGWRAGYWR